MGSPLFLLELRAVLILTGCSNSRRKRLERPRKRFRIVPRDSRDERALFHRFEKKGLQGKKDRETESVKQGHLLFQRAVKECPGTQPKKGKGKLDKEGEKYLLLFGDAIET